MFRKMISVFFTIVYIYIVHGFEDNEITEINTFIPPTTDIPVSYEATTEAFVSCTCGIFLSGQFKKGSKSQPSGNAALLHEHTDPFPCNNTGNKMCINKCIDVIMKHLPNSSSILCGAIDRDCFKEKAHLFIKNCEDEWKNSNLSGGREYCCKNGLPYKCPVKG